MSSALGKYRLVRRLATGGMGEVFLAEQEGPQSFRRRVVVKRLLKHLAADPAFVEMFLAEARVAALITHPSVAQIIELGEDDGTFFIAMEYVRGQSLREILNALRDERVPPAVAVAIMIQVLHGLHAAHTLVDEHGVVRGCVHRDVSAVNVLLSVDGAVKLVDFGIAKALDAPTRRGTVLRGKYGYMAPEQYRFARLDGRTDIFASGVLLYELLTGGRPWVTGGDAGIMQAILDEPAPSLRAAIGCSHRLDAIVERALAKEPDARFQTAEEMARELEAFAASELGGGGASALRDFARSVVIEPSPVDEGEATGAVAGTAPLTKPAAPSDCERPLGDDAPPAVDRSWFRRRAVIGLVVFVTTSAVLVAIALVATARRIPSSSAGPVTSREAVSASPATTDSRAEGRVEAPAVAAGAASPAADGDARPGAAAAARPGDPRPLRRPPPPPEKSAGVGTVAFRIRPWAEIFIDGRSVGISPVSPIELPAGRHHILLRNKNLDKERSLTTQVTRGETTTVRIDLLE